MVYHESGFYFSTWLNNTHCMDAPQLSRARQLVTASPCPHVFTGLPSLSSFLRSHHPPRPSTPCALLAALIPVAERVPASLSTRDQRL